MTEAEIARGRVSHRAASPRPSRLVVSPRQLNRATLGRQMLLRRESLDAAAAVRRVCALQAQHPASPYLALWNRIGGFDPADLDAAYARREVVRATLMRVTLQTVRAEDYPEFHQAMVGMLRHSRLFDPRFTSSGLSIAEADALLPAVAEFTARPRTVGEIEELLSTLLGERKKGVWWALRTFAALHRAPADGPWSFDDPPSFVAAGPKPGGGDAPVDAVGWLLRSYLRAFGPASARDFAQFTMLRRPTIAEAVRAAVLAGEITELAGPDREPLIDVAGAVLPAEDSVAPPRLLPMWDSVLLAYFDRSRIIPAEYRPLVIRRNGDVLPVILIDGYVTGVWRPAEGRIEITTFRRLSEEEWKGVQEESDLLTRFLAGREPDVYRRYAHWWAKGMPSTQIRLLLPSIISAEQSCRAGMRSRAGVRNAHARPWTYRSHTLMRSRRSLPG